MRAELSLLAALSSVPAVTAELLSQRVDCFVHSASFDGRFLGCRRARGGVGIIDRERSELIVYSGDPGNHSVYGPVISPDGRHVLFADYPDGPGVERDLFLLSVDGTRKRLMSLPGEELFPTWLDTRA